MKGRKPQADAIRRGRKPYDELMEVKVADGTLVKPAEIENTPRLNEYWEMVVGNGKSYTEQDLPTIMHYISYLDMAEQLRGVLFDEQGRLQSVLGYGPMDEEGNCSKPVENPYFKQYQQAVQMCMKLAQELGATPLARARLGVTKAAEQSMTVDIGRKIRDLMKEEGF